MASKRRYSARTVDEAATICALRSDEVRNRDVWDDWLISSDIAHLIDASDAALSLAYAMRNCVDMATMAAIQRGAEDAWSETEAWLRSGWLPGDLPPGAEVG